MMFAVQIFLFYIIGGLLGISLYRTYAIWVFLIGYILLFAGWYFVKQFLEELYRLDRAGIFFGLGGPAVLLAVISGFWYMILKRQGAFRDEGKLAIEELLTREK